MADLTYSELIPCGPINPVSVRVRRLNLVDLGKPERERRDPEIVRIGQIIVQLTSGNIDPEFARRRLVQACNLSELAAAKLVECAKANLKIGGSL